MPDPQNTLVALGGRLYDNWVKELQIEGREGDHPLWAEQETNARVGVATQRCTECHGWDYKGDGGVYGSGSHETGFPGVLKAGQTQTKDYLVQLMKGAGEFRHDFSTDLDDDQLSALADFLMVGTVNATQYIDYSSKKPRIDIDQENGRLKYSRTCGSCHGADGRDINSGTAESPVFIGTIANDDPWQYVHKTQFGQPAEEGMPPSITRGWTIQDVIDVLAHSQSLPTQ